VRNKKVKNGLVKLFALVLALCAALPVRSAETGVVRSAFTSGVQEREPVDKLESISGNLETLFYYTEYRGLDGQTVTHRWERNGQVVAEVPSEVKSARWRVWSRKAMTPETRSGEWTVVVVGGSGNELKRETISGTALAAEPPAAAPSQQPTQAPAAN
jgi:hypothetical protein